MPVSSMLTPHEFTVEMTSKILDLLAYQSPISSIVKHMPEYRITMKTGTPGEAMEMSFVGTMEQMSIETHEKKKKEQKMPVSTQHQQGFVTTILSSGQNGIGAGATIGYERATIDKEEQAARTYPTYPSYGPTRVESLTSQEMQRFLGQVKDVVPLPGFSPEQMQVTGIRGQSFDLIAMDEASAFFETEVRGVFLPGQGQQVDHPVLSSSPPRQRREKTAAAKREQKSILRG